MKRALTILAAAFAFAISASASDLWTVKAEKTDGDYCGISVANGGIGILPWNSPFSVKMVVTNHVFDASAFHEVSYAVKGINPFVIKMRIDGEEVNESNITGFKQELDLKHAVHTTTFTVPGKAEVKYDVRALRHLAFTGMVVVEVKALKDIHVDFESGMDICGEYRDINNEKRARRIERNRLIFNCAWAKTKYRGLDVSATSAFVVDDGDATAVSADIKKGKSMRTALAGAVCSERDFLDPFNESDREVIMVIHQGIDATIAYHEKQWEELWQGDIDIEGDDDAQIAVRTGLYHLYSFCREGSRMSISPFGLSLQGYSGHIFWDTELWMYPPMLFLNPGIAESMINYRIDRVPTAHRKAMTYGYKGAMFPWESDDAGEESCPTFALTGLLEHHITADIAIAAWNYFRMTKDMDWLRNEGWNLLSESAKFWTSRVSRNEDGSYSIVDVVGADEHACGVTDNAFTNGAAICAIKAAIKAAGVLGYKVPDKWREVADNIRILRDEKTGLTLEYEGYDGRIIKQADVNLLAYPLQIITEKEQIERDLAFYSKVIDKDGPAMSYSIMAIQYARMGNSEKAYELFRRAYKPNQLAPFGVIAESAGSSEGYFATGAGGFLQTVINGFCGLELTDDGIVQLPSVIPPHWKSVTVKGVGPDKKTYTRTSGRK